MARRGAGAMYARVTLQAPQTGDDGGGGVLAGYADRFTCRAEFIHLRGGESVLAARLQGTHSLVIRVRASSETREATTDWRIVDDATGTVFQVRDITPSDDRLVLDFLCQSGVAA